MSDLSRFEVYQNKNKNKRMLEIGERRGLPRRNATVAKSFIDVILKIDAMEEVQQILEDEGMDTVGFIEQAVQEYMKKFNRK